MDIRSRRELNYIDFGDLLDGSVFLYGDKYYMKFSKGYQSYNAVSLDGRCLMAIDDYVEVIYIKGYFVVED